MPTLRQKKAIENLVANGSTLAGAMRDAGYSANTARAPQKLTESKGFQELKEEYKKELETLGINGKKLAKKVSEWIDAVKIQSSMTEPDRVVPDYQTQLKAGEIIREDFGLKEKSPIQILNQGEMDVKFTLDE